MTGTGILLRAHLRRDRWRLLWWTLGITLLYWSQAVSVDGLYTTQAEFDRAAASMEGNAAFIAMVGPARALNTTGGQVTWQASAFGAITVGLMVMFVLGRHTRAEEESGRDELVRASAVDRRAPLTAALLEGLLASVLVGAGVAVSLVTYPLAAADSLALGVGLTLCGWVFTGTALVAAQLTSSTRSMYGIAGTVLAVAYALRAVGDVGTPALSWISPIGIYQGMHPFSGLRWWPGVLLLVAAVVSVVSAYAVFDRRDVGSGVWAARPGPAHAGRGLRGPLGLAWRLQRGSVVGWSAGLFLAALAYGSIGDDVTAMVGDSETSQKLFAQGTNDLVDGFYATSVLMLALLACGFAISSALRPRTEEDESRLEALVATALPRSRWLLAHVIVTVLGTLVVLLCAGVGLGVGYGLAVGDSGAGARLVGPVIGYAPPVLALAGVARLLHGLAPGFAVLAWLPLVLATVVLLFGDLLRLPGWLQGLSPFEHLALVPAEPFRWVPFVAVAALAVLLSGAGQAAFRHRDLR